MLEPKGIIPAMITPLTKDEKIDANGLGSFIEYLIAGGSHGVFTAGTTGEFYGFSREEKRELFTITVEQTAGRVPVYGGVFGFTTKEAVDIAQLAEECGVDAVSVLTPMFINPSQEELFEHYRVLAESITIPVILYNNQPKTGVPLLPETVCRLAEIDNIVSVKDSTGDFTNLGEYIRLTRNKNFSVLSGRDLLIYASLCQGGHGSMAACANIAPRLMADIYDKFIEGDLKGSLEAQEKIAPLRLSFTLGSFPSVIKEALQMMGIDVGPCFRPIGELTKDSGIKLREILRNLELIE